MPRTHRPAPHTALQPPRGMTRLAGPTPFGPLELFLPGCAVVHGPATVRAARACAASMDSRNPDSEIARLNAVGSGIASPPLQQAVGAALLAAYRTGGAVTPFGPDAGRGENRWTQVRVRDGGSIVIPPGDELDLSPIARGLLCDRTRGMLRNEGVDSGLVRVGDTIAVWGAPPGRRTWSVNADGGPAVPLRWGSLATATAGGATATVVAASGEEATSLAEACVRAAPDAVADLLAAHRASGIVIDADGRSTRIGAWPAPPSTPAACSVVAPAA